MDTIDIQFSAMAQTIKDMVNKEVNEKVLEVLKRISDVYKIDIDIKEILKEAGKMNIKSEKCLGLTAKGSQCMRRGCSDGYCKMHIHQKKTSPKQVTYDRKPLKPRITRDIEGFD